MNRIYLIKLQKNGEETLVFFEIQFKHNDQLIGDLKSSCESPVLVHFKYDQEGNKTTYCHVCKKEIKVSIACLKVATRIIPKW